MFDRFVAVTGHCAPWDIVHLVYRGLAVPLPWEAGDIDALWFQLF